MTIHSVRAGLLAVVVLLAGGDLAACSASAGGHTQRADLKADAPAPWPDAVPKSGLSKGLVLPLEAYMETYPESVAIQRAVDKLTTRCMARYGFTVSLPPVGRTPPPNYDDSNMGRRYGIMDRAMAVKLGYTLGDEEEAAEATAPKLSDAAVAVLTGRVAMKLDAARAPSTYQGKQIPDGGCSAEASRKVGADRIDTALPGRLDAASLDRSTSDPRVQAVISAWSQCMKSKGYTVDSPMHAANIAPYVHGQAVSAANIQVATSDVDCKSRTGLVTTWFGVESAIQRQQIEQNQPALRDVRAKITAVVEAASAVTG